MYLFEHAYPAAKTLIQLPVDYRTGMKALLDQCRADYASPLWDELAACDYEAELNRITDWWPTPRHRESPADDIEVLFIALEDVPYSFDLRGNANWSRDSENWEWWYDHSYSGPRFKSKIMEYAFERSEIHDRANPPKGRFGEHAPDNSYEVVEMFFSLAYFGLLVQEFVRNSDRSRILGNRFDRWFVVGHPDAVYGIIMGKLTRSQWHPFLGNINQMDENLFPKGQADVSD
jgi:hypothetical protein